MMFKIQQRKNVEGTIDYFLHDRELSADEKCGSWIGRGVNDLGLRRSKDGVPPPSNGVVQSEAEPHVVVLEQDLRDVLQGYAPLSSRFPKRRLNARYLPAGIRRCAWECVLSAHKSVSVAALGLSDEYVEHKLAVRAAYDTAIQETFDFFERLACHTNGRRQDVETGTLLAAQFGHLVSRHNDPHLHTHVLLANATFEPTGSIYSRWYGLETIQIYRQIREIDMVFQRSLAWHLQEGGFDAKIKKIDGLPITVLPAVIPQICRRLSRAHLAIEKEVGERWKREDREIEHKRRENMYNDDLRPPKAGSLAKRQESFASALSRDEALQIVAKLRLPAKSLTMHPQRPTKKEILQEIFQAGLQLGYSYVNPTRITRAALLASAQRLDAPFTAYWEHARQSLGWLLAGHSDEQVWADYGRAIAQHWLADTEARRFQKPIGHLGDITQNQAAGTEHTQSQSGAEHLAASEPQAHGTTLGPEAVESAPEILPPSAGQILSSLYELPGQPDVNEDQRDSSSLSL